MKKIIRISLVTGLTIFSKLLFAQADSWSSVITNGFNSSQNYDVIEFTIFNDTIYAGCGRTGFGPAELRRSGDGVTWTQVIYDATTNSVKGIPSINSTTIGGGYMWIATGNPSQGTQVYCSQNGTTWAPISKKGFGNSALWSPTPNMVLFQGTGDSIPHLYAAGNSHGGSSKSQIWRTPFTNKDSTKWSLVVNFNLKDTNCTQVTYFYVWNNELYFGSNGDSLLYQSTDGINFKANASVQTAMPGSTRLIACLISLNGYLYASTNNVILGGQLWRTDGSTWSNLSSLIPGLGVEDEELHNLDTTNGYLWITAYTDTANSSGSPIWRSTDNTVSAIVQSNSNGFDNPLNDGENPVTIGFQNRQYFGGPNYSEGGQIWRTASLTSINDNSTKNCIVNFFPNPVIGYGILRFNNKCAELTKFFIYDITGRLIKSMNSFEKNEIEIRADEFRKGMYLYNAHSYDGTIMTGKFIIE